MEFPAAVVTPHVPRSEEFCREAPVISEHPSEPPVPTRRLVSVEGTPTSRRLLHHILTAGGFALSPDELRGAIGEFVNYHNRRRYREVPPPLAGAKKRHGCVRFQWVWDGGARSNRARLPACGGQALKLTRLWRAANRGVRRPRAQCTPPSALRTELDCDTHAPRTHLALAGWLTRRASLGMLKVAEAQQPRSGFGCFR